MQCRARIGPAKPASAASLLSYAWRGWVNDGAQSTRPNTILAQAGSVVGAHNRLSPRSAARCRQQLSAVSFGHHRPNIKRSGWFSFIAPAPSEAVGRQPMSGILSLFLQIVGFQPNGSTTQNKRQSSAVSRRHGNRQLSLQPVSPSSVRDIRPAVVNARHSHEKVRRQTVNKRQKFVIGGEEQLSSKL